MTHKHAQERSTIIDTIRTQHTPGPWTLEHTSTGMMYIDLPNGQSLATVHTLADGKRNIELMQESAANARLIAAAPEMLEALETILVRLGVSPMQDDELADYCRAAITKATGGK